MATNVVMPKLGASMEQGTIVKWFIEEGSYIEKGDPLLEVLTDKISIEVEAEVDGYLLKTLYSIDDIVNVHEVIAYIGSEGEEIKEDENSLKTFKAESEIVEPSVTEKNSQLDAKSESKIRRTPAARMLAKEHDVDLASIVGTGPKGRIHKQDVQAFIQYEPEDVKATPLAKKVAQSQSIDLQEMTGTGVNGKIVRDDVSAAINKGIVISSTKEERRLPFSGMRKVIADRMSQSAYTAPHVTLTSEVDMTDWVALRKELLPSIEQINGYRLSINEVIVKVTAHTLQQHPEINISLRDNEIVYLSEVNVGMAVAVPNGLVVPVVKNANLLSLSEITKECKSLSKMARDGSLMPEQMKNGTFTISNLGMYAIDGFTPIINQPEAAILGVGRIIEKPVVVNGEIVIRSMMTLSLSFDHRIIDGAPAAAFLTQLKDTLENPYKLII